MLSTLLLYQRIYFEITPSLTKKKPISQSIIFEEWGKIESYAHTMTIKSNMEATSHMWIFIFKLLT